MDNPAKNTAAPIEAPAETLRTEHRFGVRRLTLTAMFTALAFVLSTFVYFPHMAPFQHFVDVLAEVFVGPWYAFAAALITGLLRMACGRDIGCVVGAIFGPIIGGLWYRKTHKFWSAWAGEVIGTGFVGAMTAYPLFKTFYGLDAQSPFYYVPFYTPSAAVGAALGVAVLAGLKKAGVFEKLWHQVNP